MDLELQGKTIIVTGGTTGIGRAASLLLLEEGANVAVCCRREEKLEEFKGIAKERGYEPYAQICDCSDEAAFRNFVDKTAEKYGTVDVLVNNAGVGLPVPLLEANDEQWDYVFNNNLKSMWYGIKAVVPYMKKNGQGAIVNISSYTGWMPTAGSGLYSMSKVAVTHLTKVMATELGADNIRVNCVLPGMLRTDINRKQMENPEWCQRNLRPIPLGRFGEAEEAAPLIAFLCSNTASSYVNGALYHVGGGKYVTQNPDFSYLNK